MSTKNIDVQRRTIETRIRQHQDLVPKNEMQPDETPIAYSSIVAERDGLVPGFVCVYDRIYDNGWKFGKVFRVSAYHVDVIHDARYAIIEGGRVCAASYTITFTTPDGQHTGSYFVEFFADEPEKNIVVGPN